MVDLVIIGEVVGVIGGSGVNQKQPPRVVLTKTCSEKMQQIYVRTPMPKRDLKATVLE